MPFKSEAQNRWAHTPAGTAALGGPAKVKEWEGATNYSSLPERAMSNKGYRGKSTAYAAGGPVLGRTREFLKEPVEFRDPDEGEQGDSADEDQCYAKSGEGKGTGIKAPPPAKGKVLKTVRPRS